jgi:hypothetical protein
MNHVDISAMCCLHYAYLGHFRCCQSLLFFDLLEDDGSIPQLVHSDLVSRQQMQSVSDGKRELNLAVGINIGNQSHSPETGLVPGL